MGKTLNLLQITLGVIIVIIGFLWLILFIMLWPLWHLSMEPSSGYVSAHYGIVNQEPVKISDIMNKVIDIILYSDFSLAPLLAGVGILIKKSWGKYLTLASVVYLLFVIFGNSILNYIIKKNPTENKAITSEHL